MIMDDYAKDPPRISAKRALALNDIAITFLSAWLYDFNKTCTERTAQGIAMHIMHISIARVRCMGSPPFVTACGFVGGFV